MTGHRVTCDACHGPIKGNTATVVVNTAETSNHWHLACCPLGRDPALEDGKDKDRAAA